MKSHLSWTGTVTLEVTKAGVLVRRHVCRNLVVAAGRQLFAQRIANVAATAPSHIALGTGPAAVTDLDTALGAELARVVLTSTTAVAGVATFIANVAAGTGTGTLREAGLFNAGAAGIMAARVVFDSPVVKDATEDLSVVWAITGTSS